MHASAGGTVIGMDLVAHAPPDGYTLLGASETLMLNGVFNRAKYDVRKTFVPIVQLTTQPYALLVHRSVPAKSVKELIAYAKSKAGALNFGSQGHGTNTYGYYAPAATPRAIIRAINAVVSQGMNAPETVKALAVDGNEVVAPMTPEEVKAKFEREYAALEKLIRTLNITLN